MPGRSSEGRLGPSEIVHSRGGEWVMAKIALVGAGSVVFTRNVVNDILSFPALEGSTISLMDIDPGRLELAKNLVMAMVAQRGVSAHIEATLDRTEAIRGARYVIVTIQVGGLEAY